MPAMVVPADASITGTVVLVCSTAETKKGNQEEKNYFSHERISNSGRSSLNHHFDDFLQVFIQKEQQDRLPGNTACPCPGSIYAAPMNLRSAKIHDSPTEFMVIPRVCGL